MTAARAAPCPLHPWGSGEESSQPGCSAAIGLTPGAGTAPWPCPRLQRAGATRCPGRTGTPGWGTACSSGTGSPGLWETADAGLGRLPGPGTQAPVCRVPCIGACWHVRLQDAMHWCPRACMAAECHVLVPTGVLGCTVRHVGACRCARLCDAVRWCLPMCTAARCHVLVPASMHGCTMPCVGAYRHAQPHGAMHWCFPASSTARWGAHGRADPLPQLRWEAGDRLTSSPAASTQEERCTSQGKRFGGCRHPAGSQTPTPAVLPGQRGAPCHGQAGAKPGFISR